MRHQHFFPELCPASLSHHLRRNPGQLRPARFIPAQSERNQRWPRLNHCQPELPRQLISQPGRSQLRNRQSSRRHHQCLSSKLVLRRRHTKSAARTLYFKAASLPNITFRSYSATTANCSAQFTLK